MTKETYTINTKVSGSEMFPDSSNPIHKINSIIFVDSKNKNVFYHTTDDIDFNQISKLGEYMEIIGKQLKIPMHTIRVKQSPTEIDLIKSIEKYNGSTFKGWNVMDFDIPYINARANYLGITTKKRIFSGIIDDMINFNITKDGSDISTNRHIYGNMLKDEETFEKFISNFEDNSIIMDILDTLLTSVFKVGDYIFQVVTATTMPSPKLQKMITGNEIL